jgi:hypothetical protein
MAGTWQPLATPPPTGISTMLLLTDGTVFCQENGGKNWYRLKPDPFGDYVNGSWTQLAPMKNTRLYYASAVLEDGRVFVAGGEYSDGGGDLNAAEIYDPVLNTWTSIPTPQGWTNIGDAPCCVLPDGTLLLGSIFTTQSAIYDPLTNTWTSTGTKQDTSSEETWTLLPDETVLSVECSNHPHAEKYVAPAQQWESAGTTLVELVQASSIEIGPAILLTDGRVFAIGATGHTALYTPPPLANQPGVWQAGPDFPLDQNGLLMEAKDAPACLLPNGNVLCVAGPAGEGGVFPNPTNFFEFDGTSLNPVPNPPNNGGPPFIGRMILLPTGQVLFANGSTDIEVYTPSGGPEVAWRPQLTSYPTFVRAKRTYTLHGRQLNGLSQAVSYGDDASMATNYPLVRIQSATSGKVWYCRTFDHSTMGVATGSTIQSTFFKVPLGVDLGPATLTVIANGIPSESVAIVIWPFRLHFWFNGDEILQLLAGSLADGPLWVLTPHGPVPVGPWDGNLWEETRKAYQDISSSIATLQQLGSETVAQRLAVVPGPQVGIQPSGARRRK